MAHPHPRRHVHVPCHRSNQESADRHHVDLLRQDVRLRRRRLGDPVSRQGSVRRPTRRADRTDGPARRAGIRGSVTGAHDRARGNRSLDRGAPGGGRRRPARPKGLMLRGVAAVLACVALAAAQLSAHAGLRFSSPMEGVALGDTPATIQLTMGERPEVSLSSIVVADANGATYEIGRPVSVAGDPMSIAIPVRRLDTGVYTVRWRVVSAVDGHATAGAYAFGVRASPAVGAAAASVPPPASRLEILARTLLLCGFVVLLGAALAAVARFGGPSDIPLAAAGWMLSVVGLTLLAAAQVRGTTSGVGTFLNTAVGAMFVWRAVAIAAAGLALAAAAARARRARSAATTSAMAVAAAATLVAIAFHAAGGHAAAGRWQPAATIAVQWVHLVASGCWLGGLAAILLGTRGAPSEIKASAVRRFSTIAGISIIVVAFTGVFRSVNELAAWSDLTTTLYGRVLLAKAAVLFALGGLGAFNRWHSVARAPLDLGPLRRAGGAEVVLALAALTAAATLGASPPPAGAQLPPGLSASGSDFSTTVRVLLSVASSQPGPNRFVVRVADYDSKQPITRAQVTLSFTALDDPDIPPTSLVLAPAADGSYVGSGANLAFDGRWRIGVRVQRQRTSIDVPLEVETAVAPQFVSLEQNPGQAPQYSVQVRRDLGWIRISPRSERPGPSKIDVVAFDSIGDERRLGRMVVTASSALHPVRTCAVQRLEGDRFVADIDLDPGRNRIAVVATTFDGMRLRVVLNLDVPTR